MQANLHISTFTLKSLASKYVFRIRLAPDIAFRAIRLYNYVKPPATVPMTTKATEQILYTIPLFKFVRQNVL